MNSKNNKPEEFEVDFNKNAMCENIERNALEKSSDNKKKKKQKQAGKNGKPKMKKWKKIVLIIVVLAIALAGVGAGVFFGVLNGFKGEKLDEGDVGISPLINDTYGKTEVVNIALFGVDTRDEESFSGRSDSIMIVSIDKTKNSVKITSILRDSYVAIEGHKNQKITHAYAFGKAALAVKTLNQNFNMNITDYATINYWKLGDAIDVLGGVDIEITEAERKEINRVFYMEHMDVPDLKSAGMVHMNGAQAATYVRIRQIDSDEARSNRQKKLINALLEKARQISPAKYTEVLSTMMKLCETSLSASEIMSFAPMIMADITIETTTVPNASDSPIGGSYDGAWVWRYDLNAAASRIHRFIYEGESGAGAQAAAPDSEDADSAE